jgi:hypothetical protein
MKPQTIEVGFGGSMNICRYAVLVRQPCCLGDSPRDSLLMLSSLSDLYLMVYRVHSTALEFLNPLPFFLGPDSIAQGQERERVGFIASSALAPIQTHPRHRRHPHPRYHRAFDSW